MRDIVARSYNCLELDIKAVVKEVTELFKNNYFIFSGPVSTLPFIIPN